MNCMAWCACWPANTERNTQKKLPITLSRRVLAGFASVAHNLQYMRARTNAFMENYYILSNAHARNGEIGSLNCGIIVNGVASIASAVSTTCVRNACIHVCVRRKRIRSSSKRLGWWTERGKKRRASFSKTTKINECSIFGAWIKYAVYWNARTRLCVCACMRAVEHTMFADIFSLLFGCVYFIIITYSVWSVRSRRFGERSCSYTNPIALLYTLTTFSHYAMIFLCVCVPAVLHVATT